MNSKKWILILLRVGSGILVIALTVILTEIFTNLRIYQRLINILKTIISLCIPDIVILVLFIIIIIWLIYLSKRIYSISGVSVKDKPVNIKKIIPILDKERLIVLIPLAEAQDCLGENVLFDLYKKGFAKKSRVDFKFIITNLIELRLIKFVPIITGDDTYYSITDAGVAIIRAIKNSDK